MKPLHWKVLITLTALSAGLSLYFSRFGGEFRPVTAEYIAKSDAYRARLRTRDVSRGEHSSRSDEPKAKEPKSERIKLEPVLKKETTLEAMAPTPVPSPEESDSETDTDAVVETDADVAVDTPEETAPNREERLGSEFVYLRCENLRMRFRLDADVKLVDAFDRVFAQSGRNVKVGNSTSAKEELTTLTWQIPDELFKLSIDDEKMGDVSTPIRPRDVSAPMYLTLGSEKSSCDSVENEKLIRMVKDPEGSGCQVGVLDEVFTVPGQRTPCGAASAARIYRTFFSSPSK